MSSLGEDGQVLNLTSRRALTDLRKKFVSDRINEVDMQFGRTLGCRMSRILNPLVNQSNHEERGKLGWKRIRGKWRPNVYNLQKASEGAGEEDFEQEEEDQDM